MSDRTGQVWRIYSVDYLVESTRSSGAELQSRTHDVVALMDDPDSGILVGRKYNVVEDAFLSWETLSRLSSKAAYKRIC